MMDGALIIGTAFAVLLAGIIGAGIVLGLIWGAIRLGRLLARALGRRRRMYAEIAQHVREIRAAHFPPC